MVEKQTATDRPKEADTTARQRPDTHKQESGDEADSDSESDADLGKGSSTKRTGTGRTKRRRTQRTVTFKGRATSDQPPPAAHHRREPSSGIPVEECLRTQYKGKGAQRQETNRSNTAKSSTTTTH